jgi:hypothetical protein
LGRLGRIGRNTLDQLLRRRTEIRARRACGVIAHAGGRWTAVEVPLAREALADQLGADDLAVLLDQAAIRLTSRM